MATPKIIDNLFNAVWRFLVFAFENVGRLVQDWIHPLQEKVFQAIEQLRNGQPGAADRAENLLKLLVIAGTLIVLMITNVITSVLVNITSSVAAIVLWTIPYIIMGCFKLCAVLLSSVADFTLSVATLLFQQILAFAMFTIMAGLLILIYCGLAMICPLFPGFGSFTAEFSYKDGQRNKVIGGRFGTGPREIRA